MEYILLEQATWKVLLRDIYKFIYYPFANQLFFVMNSKNV